jgi:hypothetical protein
VPVAFGITDPDKRIFSEINDYAAHPVEQCGFGIGTDEHGIPLLEGFKGTA